MSRIHEALKKAAQERSAQLANGGVEADFLELAEGPRTAPVQIVERPAAAPTNVSESPEFLRYEDLIKKCAAPKWKIDERLNVFESGDDRQLGAERFRTLRC